MVELMLPFVRAMSQSVGLGTEHLPVAAVWIAVLMITERTAQKIIQRHGIAEHEVRDAVVCVSGLVGLWDDDPERGLRALVDVVIRDRLAPSCSI